MTLAVHSVPLFLWYVIACVIFIRGALVLAIVGCTETAAVRMGPSDTRPIADRGVVRDRSATDAATVGDGSKDLDLVADAAAVDSVIRPPIPTPDDDPAIVAMITALKPGEATVLPAVRVLGVSDALKSRFLRGPVLRDFSNRMVWAPDRLTAIYAGGNHCAPHRFNDVWEFHLPSNTWQPLFEPTGGDHCSIVKLMASVLETFDWTAGWTPPAEKKDDAVRLRAWLDDVGLSMALGVIHLSRPFNAPFNPSHTWETLVYDPIHRRMLWPLRPSSSQWGGPSDLSKRLMGWAHGLSAEDVEKRFDRRNTEMWFFDPKDRTWNVYRAPEGETEVATFVDSGTAVVSLLDGRFVSFSTVTSGTQSQNAFSAGPQMRLWDARSDKWSKIGAGFFEAYKAKRAPRSESHILYSPTLDALVSAGRDINGAPASFLFSMSSDKWESRSAPPIVAHDSQSNFVYADDIDRFILVNPVRSQDSVYIYSAANDTWNTDVFTGPSLLANSNKTGLAGMAYYDPNYRVFVLHQRSRSAVWVYRPRKF